MDRDLVTRIALAAALIVLFLVASQTGFYVTVVGPLTVIGIAAIMFWPRHDDEEIAEAPDESARSR
ncbi:hypothetical protein [Corynebacterium timonense]|uniref:Uncharacterized protein n=1 Tax=Corynebacterium timonense TaxID=441500 RepID=A0A1H1ML98_9CORY|nr:hypothetical protein [Corynebacterium timonense]SDR86739.1 hypothetical protein SAMN04488539_0538 [Corynebacterium timonense]